jgi:hypothetical protein
MELESILDFDISKDRGLEECLHRDSLKHKKPIALVVKRVVTGRGHVDGC